MSYGKYRLSKSIKKYDQTKADDISVYPGLLGLAFGGTKIVNHPTRTGYVFVRLRDNQNEVILAYNDKVSPVYGLPVLIQRDTNNKNRWIVLGRDTGRYENWGNSAYLPAHGSQHSLNPYAPGADITWVYSQQFMPLNVTPVTGTSAAGSIIINGGSYYKDDDLYSIDTIIVTGVLSYLPTGSYSSLLLVYLDNSNNAQIALGSCANTNLTDLPDLLPYIPSIDATYLPLALIRLTTGTSSIGWPNLYDLRPIVTLSLATGSSAGGGGNMTKAVYDTNDDGIVNNSDMVDGNHAAAFAAIGHTHSFASGTYISGITPGAIPYGDDSESLTFSEYFYNITTGSSLQPIILLGTNQLDAEEYMLGYRMNIIGESSLPGTDSDLPLALWRFRSTPTSPAGIDIYRGRNAINSPTALLKGDMLFRLSNYGYCDNAFGNSGLDLIVYAAENFSGSGSAACLGSLFDISITPTGSSDAVSTFRMAARYGKFAGDFQIPGTYGLYFGGPTTMTNYAPDFIVSGSWREIKSGNNLVFQYYDSATWDTILTLTPTGTSVGGGGGSSHIIQDDGVSKDARSKLNFVGSGFVVYDDSGNDATVVSGTATGSGTGDVVGPSSSVDRHLVVFNGTTGKLIQDGGWYPNTNFVVPDLDDFAWINKGSGTATAERGAITLYDQAFSATINLKILKMAAPATPYTVTVSALVNSCLEDNYQFCIGWRQNSDGKLALAKYYSNGGLWYVHSSKHASPTDAAVDYVAVNVGSIDPVWLRITDDGTNRICYFSIDGYNFIRYHSIGRTDYLTGDEVCIAFNAKNATYSMYATWLSWAIT